MNKITIKTLSTVLFSSIILMGCNQIQNSKSRIIKMSEIEPMCSMPSGNRIDDAFSHAREDLVSTSCQHQYDKYFTSLLNVASGDPGAENRKRFSDFISWSHDRGIISRIQGKDFYTRYFSSTFRSLPDTRNVCSATRNKQSLLNDLQAELKLKKKGLLEVAGDRDSYFETIKQHGDIVLVLEATAMACEAES
jgi:hypothetical protein